MKPSNILAFSLIVQSNEDIWYIFCTPMTSNKDSVNIDLWCPENPIFTCRESFPLKENLIDAVQKHICYLAHNNYLDTDNLKISKYTHNI